MIRACHLTLLVALALVVNSTADDAKAQQRGALSNMLGIDHTGTVRSAAAEGVTHFDELLKRLLLDGTAVAPVYPSPAPPTPTYPPPRFPNAPTPEYPDAPPPGEEYPDYPSPPSPGTVAPPQPPPAPTGAGSPPPRQFRHRPPSPHPPSPSPPMVGRKLLSEQTPLTIEGRLGAIMRKLTGSGYVKRALVTQIASSADDQASS